MDTPDKIEQVITSPGCYRTSVVLALMRGAPLAAQARVVAAAKRAEEIDALDPLDIDLYTVEFCMNIIVSGGRTAGYDPYRAIEELVVLFSTRFDEFTRSASRTSELVLGGIKSGFARMADGGNLEDSLVTQVLEEMFRDAAKAEYFQDWSKLPETRKAYAEAIEIVWPNGLPDRRSKHKARHSRRTRG